jgi:hypothetical protein
VSVGHRPWILEAEAASMSYPEPAATGTTADRRPSGAQAPSADTILESAVGQLAQEVRGSPWWVGRLQTGSV